MDKKRILIIDDEEDLSFFVKANLELAGNYEVIIATSGSEGIDIASSQKIDLILLDIMMPKMDGFEVLEEIKKSRGVLTMPVIMLTAKGDMASKIKAAGSYSEDYLVKPVKIEILKTKIDQVLQRAGLSD